MLFAELRATRDTAVALAAQVDRLTEAADDTPPRVEVDRKVEHVRVDATRRRRSVAWLMAAGIVAAVNLHGVRVAYCVTTTPATFAAEAVCEMALPFTPETDGGSGFDARPLGGALYLAVFGLIATFELAVRAADRYRNHPDTDGGDR